MIGFYNIYTDTDPPRARPGPSRPSSASGGPPAAARCGGVTNPTAEHRDAVGRSEAQLGVCIAHPGLSPGPINRRLRRRGQELLFTAAQTLVRHSTYLSSDAVEVCGTSNPALLASYPSELSKREGETIEGSRTMRNRPYPVLKCSS